MTIKWVLTVEARADLARILQREIHLRDLFQEGRILAHPLRLDDGTKRPVWRLGRAHHKAYLVVMSHQKGDTLVRTIVEAKPPHEAWRGPERAGKAPSRTHKDLAHAAQAVDIDTSPATVRDMSIPERHQLAEQIRAAGGTIPESCQKWYGSV